MFEGLDEFLLGLSTTLVAKTSRRGWCRNVVLFHLAQAMALALLLHLLLSVAGAMPTPSTIVIDSIGIVVCLWFCFVDRNRFFQPIETVAQWKKETGRAAAARERWRFVRTFQIAFQAPIILLGTIFDAHLLATGQVGFGEVVLSRLSGLSIVVLLLAILYVAATPPPPPTTRTVEGRGTRGLASGRT